MSKSAHFYAGFVSCALLVVAVLVLIHETRASDWAVGTVGSRHLGGGNFCETNPGVGVERGEEVRTLIGVYRNSLCDRWSVYLGKSWLPLRYADWRLGVAGMAITGYESPITLGAAAVLSYEREKHGFNIVWFPDSSGNLMKGVIALQIKKKF